MYDIKEIILTSKEDVMENKENIENLYKDAKNNLDKSKNKFYITLAFFTINVFLLCYSLVERDMFLILINLTGAFFAIRNFLSLFEIIKLTIGITVELEVIMKIINNMSEEELLKFEIDM